tara:strand:- start:71 stop:211 length:141 start_codon:yes stop_codon:yes gene_type:complete
MTISKRAWEVIFKDGLEIDERLTIGRSEWIILDINGDDIQLGRGDY